MKNLLILVITGLLSLSTISANAINANFSSLFNESFVKTNEPKVLKPFAKTKSGNEIGENTIEINLGIITITIKRIVCDKMENRICYEKKGEEPAQPVMIITDDNIITGELQTAPQEIDYGNYTVTIFKFYSNTFHESNNYSGN